MDSWQFDFMEFFESSGFERGAGSKDIYISGWMDGWLIDSFNYSFIVIDYNVYDLD